MRKKYWTIIILTAFAILAGVLYWERQPAEDLGPITIPRLQNPQSTSTTSRADSVEDTPSTLQDDHTSEYYTIILNNHIFHSRQYEYIQMDAYSNTGLHTGYVSDSKNTFIEHKIPNSSMSNFGGDVHMVLDTNYSYTLKLTGKQDTLVTLKVIAGLQGHKDEAKYTYYYPMKDPQTPSDMIEISSNFRANMALPRGGFTTPPDLKVDFEGDGKIDKIIKGVR